MAQKHPVRRGSGGPPPTFRARLQALLRPYLPRRISLRRLFVATVSIVGYTALLEVDLFRAGITWDVGEIAERDVLADRAIEFVDDEGTQKLRQAARDAVGKQYDVLPVASEAAHKLQQLFEDVAAVAADEGLPRPQKIAQLSDRMVWLNVAPATLGGLLDLPPERRLVCRDDAVRIVGDLYADREIRSDAPQDLETARAEVPRRLAGRPADEQRLLGDLLRNPDLLKPNRRYNADATADARDRAAEAVEPVRRTISRGQLIVQRAHRVTEENLRDLRALGMVQPKRDYRGLLSLAALVCLTVVILGTYVRMELPEVWADNRRMLLLNLIAALGLLTFRVLLWLKNDVPSIAHPAILCGATTGMVVAVLIEYRLAMMMTGTLALFLGILMPGAGLWVAFEAWLAGRVGAMALRRVRDRNDLARAGVITAVAGMFIAAIVQLPRSGDLAAYEARHLSSDLLFGFGWGMLAFLLAQGIIPLLERPFGCITPFRLLDLTNTSSPLLQRLKRCSRGTFDASLTIGDMAADACEAIGADALLARACGYHHDIGKINHPTWFIENQFGAGNVHDHLEPTLSALAIKSHVSEGLVLAREYHLPQPLHDAIAQHHGTTLISFFYYQALERAAEDESVREEMFRYEGPRPQSKEIGIIMLADGVEAAVRAAAGHGSLPDRKINEIVEGLIKKRLDDHQLDECSLTLRELNVASQAFCEYLRGMYHSRIDYPPPSLRGKERREGANGGVASGRD